MKDKNKAAVPEKAVKAEEPRQPEKAAAKFTIERLRPYAREVFGVSQSTFDGATYGVEGEFTVDEMKKRIEDWLKEAM